MKHCYTKLVKHTLCKNLHVHVLCQVTEPVLPTEPFKLGGCVLSVCDNSPNPSSHLASPLLIRRNLSSFVIRNS